MNYINVDFVANGAVSEYQLWLATLRPRTCLVINWLADLGAVAEPGRTVRAKARRFAAKNSFVGVMAERTNEAAMLRVNSLCDLGVLDDRSLHTYAIWVMWLRFQEYVPRRFVLPGGRDKVLVWVRERLYRPELTSAETLGELRWQAAQISAEWEEEFLPFT